MKKLNNAFGFTLVELMIVVAIIGILAAVASPAYIRHVYRIRETTGYQLLLDVQTAQEKFYALKDTYAQVANNVELVSMLGFDPTDTTYYKFSFTAAANDTYTARISADLNGDGGYTNCWEISQPPSEPTLNEVAAGCENDEGFGLSLIGGLF